MEIQIPTLHNFQIDIQSKKDEAIRNGHKRIIIQSPTGSGKTMMFCADVYRADKKNKKCLIITDRDELLTGSGGTISKFNIEAEYIKAGLKEPPKKYKHCIAMSQTIRNRINIDNWILFFNSFDIVIIDEAHVQEFNIYFVFKIFKSNVYIFGYTATPHRNSKQRALSEDYSILIEGPSVEWLIRNKFLVRDNYYAPNHFNPLGIQINSFGEYNESQMFKRFEETVSYSSVITNWRKYSNNKITIVFCVNKEHVLNTCFAFNKAGIKAKFIISPMSKPQMPSEKTNEKMVVYNQKIELYEKYLIFSKLYSGERDDVINRWKSGEFPVLINAGIFVKGFDFVKIETVLVLRKTTSVSLWLQMIGRGSRICNGKTSFNILDFGSNAENLGMYAQERVWTLENTKQTSSGVAPVKECGKIKGKNKTDKLFNNGCGCLILATRKICQFCGYIFEQDEIEIDIDLVKIDYLNEKYKYNDIDFARLEREAEERGRKNGWIINIILSKGGLDAIEHYRQYKGYNKGWIYTIEKLYAEKISQYNKKMQSLQ